MSNTKKQRKPPVLTSKQNRHLRALGHHLNPVAMLGKEGIDTNLLRAVNEVLDARELIKVKIQENCPYERKEAAAMLAEKTQAALVQVIGRVFLLYRENSDLRDDRRIILP